MKITVLVENVTPSDRFCSRHGLSLFIEVAGKRILFDMGPDASFLDNARALGVDVTTADFAVISHGHFDHGGGLRAFLELTEAAGRAIPIYVHERAFEDHRANTPAGMKDIGIDPALLQEFPGRFVLTGDSCEPCEGMTLFANVQPERLAPRSNKVLLERAADGVGVEGVEAFAPDAFAHEQSLLIRDSEGTVLLSGCSHCGIVSIMERAEALAGAPLRAVVGGFHLMNPASGAVEDPQVVAAVAQFMAERPTHYATFHCTGLAAYGILRDELGPRVDYLYTSSVANL